MNSKIHIYGIKLGLCCLIAGLIAGLLATVAFLAPPHISQYIPFQKFRPVHVSLMLFWILTTSAGGIIYYLREIKKKPLIAPWAIVLFLLLWVITILIIQFSYLTGNFGGREYWEYPPVISILILVSWVFLIYFFFKNVVITKNQPVYIWMWITGIIMFFISFVESNLWLLPWFKENIVRDITLQWKSNGSIVGAWNMLVYGTGIYIMTRISGSDAPAKKPVAFFFYFLGLANLLFNWGHHLYTVPTAPWIRHIAYAVTMTEWIILINIIRNWRKSVKDTQKYFYILPYRFLLAAEFWIFINLILALLISIPAINVYTHGTHITVAHAMGTTIGINTMMLLGSVTYILNSINKHRSRLILRGYWITNISVFIFLTALISAGITKGYYTTHLGETNFQEVMRHVYPSLWVFGVAGVGVIIGLLHTVVPLFSVKSKIDE